MADLKPCSASTQGAGLCRNGFPQTATCWGNACHFCGKPSGDVPMCMRDDQSPRVFAAWFNDSGLPKFATSGGGNV